jgi:2-polyprenyl-3-methyl-5-hydroxy-6-metoxy-1,4-benzoquinol methylase
MSNSQHKFSEDKIYVNAGNQAILNIVPKSALTILDIGFGNGSNARILKERGAKLDGITLSELELSYSKDVFREAIIFNVEKGLPEKFKQNKYDAILMSHVLEHIAYPENLLSDLRNVLAQNGELIIAVPNLLHYKTRFQLLRGNFYWHESGIWDYTHLRWYTKKLIYEMASRSGFQVSNFYATGFLPAHSVLRRILPSNLYKALFNILLRISNGFFGDQYIVSLKIRNEKI